MIAVVVSPKDFLEKYGANHHEMFPDKAELDVANADGVILVEKQGSVIAYSTFKDLGDESVYLAFGGSFKESRGSFSIVTAFNKILETIFEVKKEIFFNVKNTNFPMLKLAWKFGFIINGLHVTPEGHVLLSHILRRPN